MGRDGKGGKVGGEGEGKTKRKRKGECATAPSLVGEVGTGWVWYNGLDGPLIRPFGWLGG